MDRSDFKNLEKLIKMLEESSLAQLELTLEDGKKISLSKPTHAAEHAYVPMPAPQPVAATPAAPAQAESAAAPEAPAEEAGHKVASPMVGTVYVRPSPGDDAFVNVGDTVKVGDVICLLEAMKVFSKIKADKAGVIKSIKIEDGQAVEFGQTLFIIEG